MRYAAVARATYGAFLLFVPGAVIQVASGESVDRASAVVGRVLGARHLVQALVLERAGTRGSFLVGAAIDAVHALSMVGLAALSRNYRRPAALDAALATGLAINGLREAQNAS
jgi:hypothetical protein